MVPKYFASIVIITTNIPRKPFCAWWSIFNAFMPPFAIYFRTTHRKNNTPKCDTEGSIPVAILNGVVVSPSSFIRYFIGRSRKIWYVLYINTKWIYTSETLAYTIRDCTIVRNVLEVTLTCPFISWCSGAANVKWTPRAWNYFLNSFEVNCVPASAEILSKSHYPNSSIFPNLDWNISSLFITSSLVISPYHKVLEFWSRNQKLKHNQKMLCHVSNSWELLMELYP